jgi:hypothetical protein
MDDDHDFEDFVKDLAKDLVERGNNLISDPRKRTKAGSNSKKLSASWKAVPAE